MALRILMCMPGAASVGGLFHFKLGVQCRLLALNGQSRQRNILSAIGATADKFGFWAIMVCPLMTRSGHQGRLQLTSRRHLSRSGLILDFRFVPMRGSVLAPFHKPPK
jgi:hypothetical protein